MLVKWLKSKYRNSLHLHDTRVSLKLLFSFSLLLYSSEAQLSSAPLQPTLIFLIRREDEQLNLKLQQLYLIFFTEAQST